MRAIERGKEFSGAAEICADLWNRLEWGLRWLGKLFSLIEQRMFRKLFNELAIRCVVDESNARLLPKESLRTFRLIATWKRAGNVIVSQWIWGISSLSKVFNVKGSKLLNSHSDKFEISLSFDLHICSHTIRSSEPESTRCELKVSQVRSQIAPSIMMTDFTLIRLIFSGATEISADLWNQMKRGSRWSFFSLPIIETDAQANRLLGFMIR